MWNRTSKQRKSAQWRRKSYVRERLERERIRIARTLERETRAARRAASNVIPLPQKPKKKPRRAR